METPEDQGALKAFLSICWDTATNIVFLLGVCVIELGLRPLFGPEMPIFARLFLTVSDIALLIGLLRRLWISADNFIDEICSSKTTNRISKVVRRFHLQSLFQRGVQSKLKNIDSSNIHVECELQKHNEVNHEK